MVTRSREKEAAHLEERERVDDAEDGSALQAFERASEFI
jgi:hypothetical protein